MPFLEEIHAEIAFQTIIEMLIYRMLRLRSLYYEHSLLFASSASSTKLQKQLQCLLIRTEVLNSEQTVSSYDRHKAKIAEIEAFGNYLCSYKDINLTFAEFLDGLLFKVTILRSVAIKSCDAGLREEGSRLLLDPLGSSSE